MSCSDVIPPSHVDFFLLPEQRSDLLDAINGHGRLVEWVGSVCCTCGDRGEPCWACLKRDEVSELLAKSTNAICAACGSLLVFWIAWSSLM